MVCPEVFGERGGVVKADPSGLRLACGVIVELFPPPILNFKLVVVDVETTVEDC